MTRKNIFAIVLAIIIYLGAIVFWFVSKLVLEKKEFTRKELEQGLQRVEIIYIIDSDFGWVHDVIYTFTKDEEQKILEEITKIEFLRSQPHSSEGYYALKFCYDEFSLMIAPTIIVKLDSNNSILINSRKMYVAGKEVVELIDKYLDEKQIQRPN